MLKDHLIIIPFLLPWERAADYQRQTCRVLSEENTVIGYMHEHAHFFLKQDTYVYPKIDHVMFYVPIYIFPFRRIPCIERLNQLVCLWYLLLKYGRRQKTIVWIFDPFFHFFGKRWSGAVSFYDCVDYHWSRTPEEKLIRVASHFFVNSHVLYKLHGRIRKPDTLVPQGFDLRTFKKFHNFNDNDFKLSTDKPTIGYVGAMNYRLDFDLLFPLISRNPGWVFLFAGPMEFEQTERDIKTRKQIERLLKLRNVHYAGAVDRKNVPSIIARCDICVIPYDISLPLNRYCYPMKLFEYFYMGKPVISTPIEELRRFPLYVKIGGNAIQWEKNIRMLLRYPWPEQYQKNQRRLAQANSWEKKIEVISRNSLPKSFVWNL